MRKLFSSLLVPFVFGSYELVCDFGEDCEKFCMKKICEYRWSIKHSHSMSWRAMDHHKGKFQDFPMFWNEETQKLDIEGIGYHSNDHWPVDKFGEYLDPQNDLKNMIPIDGRGRRRVITINDKFTGPTLRVRAGAVIKVVVRNELPTEALTVHWHGFHQTDNYWMDGAAYASQCPVPAHHSFTYVFKAEVSGTFWYHSHNAIQRQDGLYGGIIVHDKNEAASKLQNDIPLIITDWYNVDATELSATNPYNMAGTNKFVGTAQYHCRDEDKAFHHGVKVSSLCMDSVTVNGYGQFRNHFNASDAFASVKQNYVVSHSARKIKFRAIHAGFEIAVRMFRTDGKSLTVINSDAVSIRPIEVTDVVIGIGETYDIEMNLPEDLNDCHIRIELLATCRGMKCDDFHIPFVDVGFSRSKMHLHNFAEKLEWVLPSEPIKPIKKCQPQEDGKCLVFNCPWLEFLTGDNARNSEKQCKFIHEARRDTSQDSKFHVLPPTIEETPDKIFNLTFNFAHGSSINNIKFKYPKVPLYHDPSLWGFEECPEGDIPVEGTSCTQVLTANVGDLVELRLIGAESPTSKARRWMWTYHTAHMHGNDFFLMNMGFPETFKNGSIKGINNNLKCLDDACSKHEWNEEAIQASMIQSEHIGKNTLLLPAQGYSIVRFRAENPGYWPLHCHNMMHNLEGMMLFFHIKDPVQNRPFSMIPDGLPQCANHAPMQNKFPWEMTPSLPLYAQTYNRDEVRTYKKQLRSEHRLKRKIRELKINLDANVSKNNK